MILMSSDIPCLKCEEWWSDKMQHRKISSTSASHPIFHFLSIKEYDDACSPFHSKGKAWLKRDFLRVQRVAVAAAWKWILHRPAPYLGHIWPITQPTLTALERHKSVAGWFHGAIYSNQYLATDSRGLDNTCPAFQLLVWKTCVNTRGGGGAGDIRIVLPRINRFARHILARSL